jgi:hypothetical protein
MSGSLRWLFVVLANARTHNHRLSLLQTVGALACSIRSACGYGFPGRVRCAHLPRTTWRETRHKSTFSRHEMSELLETNRPRNNRGRREGRVPAAPMVRVQQESTRQNRINRPSLRKGFLRALPGDHAWLPPSPARRESVFTTLAPASERQNHTTLPSAQPSFVRANVALDAVRPSHPAPTFVTMANAPLVGRDGGNCKFDLGQTRSGIFLRAGMDRFSRATKFLPVGQISR